MTVITDTATLARFCAEQSGTSFVAVDTEFMRERTYWPILCLVQVAGPTKAAAIDALAPGIDLTPLLALMADESILKVFHAARQDVEIFFNLSGTVPTPLFDTQIAAMVCGFGDAASYETLVGKLAQASLDKSSRFTDWSHRPLTDRQIRYALADVVTWRGSERRWVVFEARRASPRARKRSAAMVLAALANPRACGFIAGQGGRDGSLERGIIVAQIIEASLMTYRIEMAAWRHGGAEMREQSAR